MSANPRGMNSPKVDHRILTDAATQDRIMAGYTQTRLLQMAQFAIAIDNHEALAAVMKHVKYVDVPIRGSTLLMTAAEHGKLEAAKVLVDQFHADKDATNLSGNTAYDIAVMRGDHEMAAFLGLPTRPDMDVRTNRKTMSMK